MIFVECSSISLNTVNYYLSFSKKDAEYKLAAAFPSRNDQLFDR